MKIRNRNYLFILTKGKVHDIICKQCRDPFKEGDLVYSKRKKNYYCKVCTIKLHLLPKRLIEKFLEAIQ